MGRYQGRSKGRRKKGFGNGGGKKNKLDRNSDDANNSNPNGRRDASYTMTIAEQGNFKMEAYYAAQGMHDGMWNGTGEFVPCRSDKERHQERHQWRQAAGAILPASFRMGKHLPALLQDKMEHELNSLLREATVVASQQQSNTTADLGDKNEAVAIATTTTTTTNSEKAVQVGTEQKATLVGIVDDEESNNPPVGQADIVSQESQVESSSSHCQQEQQESDSTVTMMMVRKLSFLPHAYQMSLDRGSIRKHTALAKLKQWLVDHTDAGHVQRQETVSMIPPVVLQVQPGDIVLDMCAAPGSKTSQLMEMVCTSIPSCRRHHDRRDATIKTGDGECTGKANHEDGNDSERDDEGVVVANDANVQRAHMLVHQLRKGMIHLPQPAVLVTAVEAQHFALDRQQQFDKILCDVPCSGDGTTRKNVGIWRFWNQRNALALHTLQLQIAWKGVAQLLKLAPLPPKCPAMMMTMGNGSNRKRTKNPKREALMCYSTCSMNPVENEAVVAELLRRAGGKLELIDTRALLPGFKVRPGWSTWHVLCEPQTRREDKNIANKNNAKMHARRQAYQQEKQQTQPQQPNPEQESKQQKSQEQEQSGGDVTADDHVMTIDSLPPVVVGEEGNVDHGAIEREETLAATHIDNGNSDDPTPSSPSAPNGPPRLRFQPTSMTKETLLQMAQEAGMEWFPTAQDVPVERQNRIRSSVFPPTPQEAEQFHLERCMRCLPHDNDTGGFFVALLRKTGPISKADRRNMKTACSVAETATTTHEVAAVMNSPMSLPEPDLKRARVENGEEAEHDSEEEGEGGVDVTDETAVDRAQDDDDALDEDDLDGDAMDEDNKPARIPAYKNSMRNRNGGEITTGKDDFVPIVDSVFAPIVQFFGLNDPLFPRDQFMIRASGEGKAISYLSKQVKHLIDMGIQQRVNVVNSGLKAFVRNKMNCADVSYRLSQECAHIVTPYMTKRKIMANFHDFELCLRGCRAPVATMTTTTTAVAVSERADTSPSKVSLPASNNIPLDIFSTTFQDEVRSLSVGCFAVVLDHDQVPDAIQLRLICTMWRCVGDNIDRLIPKQEIPAMQTKLDAVVAANNLKKSS